MPARSLSESSQKAAVSVTEMARLCGLSRSHFYSLVDDGVMPQPVYAVRNRRPFYPRELIEVCLKVKATNIGLDGRYVVFYAPRCVNVAVATVQRDRAVTRRGSQTRTHAELLDGLKALGMQSSGAHVEVALRACFPSGHAGIDVGLILWAV